MTAVVIDASAGVEIVADTRRGRALGRLLWADSELWVLRRRFLIERAITESQTTAAVRRLGLRNRPEAPLLAAGWAPLSTI